MANKSSSGSTLIEVVVVAGILSAVSLAFLGTFAILSQFHPKNLLAIKGGLLAEEGMEVIRFLKSGGWQGLADIPKNTDTYLSLSASGWDVATAPEVIDGQFYRSFRTGEVGRDFSDDISSAGSPDPGTLLVEVRVDWSWKGATTTEVYKSYMADI